MPALYVKVFAERNCGGSWINRLLRKNFRVAVLDGTPAIDGAALRRILQAAPSGERLDLHNTLLDIEHDRLIYSDFGWTAGAPPRDIIRSAAHSRDTHFIVGALHPLRFLKALHMFPRTPGAATDEVRFEDFLVRPFALHRRDGLPTEEALEPLHLWQRKMSACLDLLEEVRSGTILRIEDLEKDAANALADLDGPLLIKPNGHVAVPPVNRLISMSEAQEAWARLPDSVRHHVVAQADTALLARLGYAMPGAG